MDHKLFISRYAEIRVVNAFQMDMDAQHMDSYDKRSRPSVISLQSLQAQKAGGVSRKPNLASSPEVIEAAGERGEHAPRVGHAGWFSRSESIPYADEL
ncbi:hypothetical protein RRG08_066777 [Elysia crispata]|uniref:Uncharacterized protein n=1 Tax=Elysia crispata TaxID=231223 RepID=A0AAE1CK29_9GAST|nr:hypothetical protein RRG08_066777 [Elysia crispata]